MKSSLFPMQSSATQLPFKRMIVAFLTVFVTTWGISFAGGLDIGGRAIQSSEQTEKPQQEGKNKKKADTTESASAKKEDQERGSGRPVRKNDEEEEKRPETISFSKSKKKVDPSKTNEMTFDDIKFDMEKGTKFSRSMLTPEIESYDGATVRLRGYIRPSFRQTGLTKFVFVRDNKECCFGPGAAIFDCVLVELEKGRKTDYTVRPVTVEGSFFLKEFKGPDGKIWAIYRMKKGKVN